MVKLFIHKPNPTHGSNFNLFITVTFNPNWSDIKNNVCTNEMANDRTENTSPIFMTRKANVDDALNGEQMTRQ